MPDKSYTKLIIASILGALLVVSVFSPTIYNVGPFDIRAEIQLFHRGETEVEITPFGKVRANTHFTPVKLGISLEQIDLDQLTTFLELGEDDSEEFVERWEDKFYETARAFIIKILFLAALGGFLSSVLIGFRKKRDLFLGGIIGVIFLALIFVFTYSSYDYMAFMNPEFEGAVESFPWIMGLIDESIKRIGQLGEQLELISTNLYALFQRIDELDALGGIDGAYRVLHVSDIHNNPAAYDFIFQITESFDADFIIDTGDITDYGTPFEAELANRIGELDIPYVFIPGNHDSPVVIDMIKTIPNVTVLEEGLVEVLDFKIAGIKDPSSVSKEMAVKDEEVLMEYAHRLEYGIEKSGVKPDIIGVHHPTIAERFLTECSLVLTGHTHRLGYEIQNNSILIDAGTTGAAGIRGFEVDEDLPYSLALLHMNEDKELIAADLIEITDLEGGYRIERIIPGNNEIIAE